MSTEVCLTRVVVVEESQLPVPANMPAVCRHAPAMTESYPSEIASLGRGVQHSHRKVTKREAFNLQV